MHAFLSHNYNVIVAAAGVLGSVGYLSFLAGVRLASRRISRRLKNDREFGIIVLEDLALRWGVKIELTETPGSS
jgi:hypothetical protein